MKIIIIISVAFCFASNLSSGKTFNPELLSKVDDDLRELIEGIKVEMVNGFPQYGIPPLAPYQQNSFEVDYNNDNFIFLGNFTDLIVSGLNDFDVVTLHFAPITQKLNFEFNFNHIHILSDYNANVWVTLFGIKQHINGNGKWEMDFKDLRFNVSLRLIPNLNGIQIGSFVCEMTLGSVKSDITGIMDSKVYTAIINQWIEEFLLTGVNDNVELIGEHIKNEVVPLLNYLLGNYSLDEIIEFIFGKN